MDFIPEGLFIKILNMSITASYVIVAILVLRLFLRKAPKVFAYVLWSVAGFRLLCPISFSSVFSIFNSRFIQSEDMITNSGIINYIPSDIGYMKTPTVVTGVSSVSNVINNHLPAATPYASVNPMQIITTISAYLWFFGILFLLLYSIASYIKLKNRVRKSVLLEGNIFECDRISSPFVLGVIKPKIYIPFRLSKQELNYIIKHEQYHIHRLDHVIKPCAFLVIILHWFNPLVWVAFFNMSKDMEMSCDEKVISDMGNDIKNDYSMSLLSFASGRRWGAISPLAFGETSTKSRIKNVMRFKKPKFWVILLISLVCILIGTMCVANPLISKNTIQTPSNKNQENINQNNSNNANQVSKSGDKMNEEATGHLVSDLANQLYNNKNQYIGNASSDGKLLSILGIQTEFGNYTIVLDTRDRPYVLRINFKATPIEEDNLNQKMCRNATLLLALINNADEIQWSYPINQNGNQSIKTVSFNEEFLEVPGIKNIKNYGRASIKIQELLDASEHIFSSSNYIFSETITVKSPLSDIFGTKETYQLPKGFSQSEYMESIGYNGGVLFLKNGTMPQEPPYSSAPIEWYAPGAALYIAKELTTPIYGNATAVTFDNGKLIRGTLFDNHSCQIGEPIILEGLKEQAVLMEYNFDLYTVPEADKAEEEGHAIPKNQLTGKAWKIFFAKDVNYPAYCFVLNEKYFSKQDAIDFAKSVKFSEDAFK